jgi:hypothetical protein
LANTTSTVVSIKRCITDKAIVHGGHYAIT